MTIILSYSNNNFLYRCAEIQGWRDAWRNARGMVWPVQRWFDDQHDHFDSDAR